MGYTIALRLSLSSAPLGLPLWASLSAFVRFSNTHTLLTVSDGVSVCGHASVSGRHASGLCIEYSFPIDTPPVGPRLDEVSAHTPAPACTPRCFGYRNHTPESPALPMQSPAVSRSRHLTVCDGVSVCASAIVPDIRYLGYRNLTLETSSPSSQSSAVASPGPAKCCARSTSPLCHAVI